MHNPDGSDIAIEMIFKTVQVPILGAVERVGRTISLRREIKRMKALKVHVSNPFSDI
jgi:hypothetical protein